MKRNTKLIGYTRNAIGGLHPIRANSHSIAFGNYRLTRSKLRQKLKQGKGRFHCYSDADYRWVKKNGGIDELRYGYRIPPALYKKIVKWSKSK